ncbi:Protoporphyrinogen IX dehydrogenase (menaquinone) [invertebrate metagenome]|uniref:Protoporphyrinogen IX dehydrogenase (Menaquinone) n=1 Tax=invertebrate metagenome TaxID=1711999 RepID=A0A2H9TAL5_9ZZZZ
MMKIGFLYKGCEGQTRKIMDKLSGFLMDQGYQVQLFSIDELPRDFSLEALDAYVLGCSVRYGKHHKPFVDFVKQYADQLNRKPSFFFSVNLTARKANRNKPYTNQYLCNFLRTQKWQPDHVAVFAGALFYRRYTMINRLMIQLIMKMTGGSTDINKDIEYTDWQKVETFAGEIASHLISSNK